jgi:hypothetical protein
VRWPPINIQQSYRAAAIASLWLLQARKPAHDIVFTAAMNFQLNTDTILTVKLFDVDKFAIQFNVIA